jgi:tetratricopeptide (TPR) repeat protein
MALCHKTMGNFNEAVSKYELAVKIYSSSVGERHSSTLTTMNNLAATYSAIADRTKGMQRLDYLERARELATITLDERRKELSSDHPQLAPSLNVMASLFRKMRKFKDAEQYQRESLSILINRRGEDHLETMTALNQLALIEKQRGNLDAALDMYERVYQVRVKQLGEEHAESIAVLFNIYGVYVAKDDEDKAYILEKKIMELCNLTDQDLENYKKSLLEEEKRNEE